MEKKRLEMDFVDELDKRFRLSIDAPKADLDAGKIEAAMDEVISNNIFISNGVDLASYNAARIVTTSVEEFEF